MKTVTACTLDCPDACSLVVEVGPDGSVEIGGNPAHPLTAGFVCPKIRGYGRMLRHPQRITTPLLKVDGEWQPIAWPAALRLCADKIDLYRREPASILHIFDVGNKGLLPLSSHRFFSELGSTRVGGSVCDTAGIAACVEDFGALDHNDILDLANARRIVNWGKDLSRSSVHTAGLVRRARHSGARVLTIAPGGDTYGRTYTDEFVRIRPGADRFLAAAVIRLLVERDRVAPGVLEHTADWPAFRSLVVGQSPARLAADCGLEAADVERVYEFYVRDEPTASIIGYGLQRHDRGGENVRFINALALLAGHVGRSGGGSYFNLSSARNFNMDWLAAPGDAARRTLWLPTIGPDILAAQDPPIRMIWVNGCNVVNQAPESRTIERAFASVEFKVVVEALMNDTAARADLILPCALMLEQEDVVGSFMHNYVNYVAPVVPPPDGARTDHWILSEVGRRLDPPVVLPDAETLLRAALDSPYLDRGERALEDLRERGFVRAARPDVAFADLHFAHPDGKYRFPASLHDEPPAPADYPLRLLTLVRREAVHSQILPEDHAPWPTVWLSPDSPVLPTVDLERPVFLASPRGRLRVRVETMAGLHPSACIYRRGDWMMYGGGANQLIDAGLTDIGQGAPFYQQFVRLEN